MIGDVYFVHLRGHGNEQRGGRPCVVFQNNIGNKFSPNVIVLPLTSSIKKIDQPTHVFVPSAGTGLRFDSVVLCENPECVSKDRLGSYITALPDDIMRKVVEASLVATSGICYLAPDELMLVWAKAVAKNGFSPLHRKEAVNV